MNAAAPRHPRIAVIGGGISGLTAAYRLHELRPEIDLHLFESGDRLGGVIRTERIGQYLVEHGADMFTTRDPWAVALCDRLGIRDQLLNTNSKHAKAYVVRRGRLYPVPEGFTLMTPRKAWPIVFTPLLGITGKLRMACECLIPRRNGDADESLADFATRRLGKQAYERLVQPLVGGIYTADPTKLSMQAALPQFVEMEREHGGLIRSSLRRGASVSEAERSSSGARYGMFVAPREGMQQLLDALLAKLPAATIHRNTQIMQVSRRDDGKWHVASDTSDVEQPYDAVIFAVPAGAAAKLLAPTDPPLADDLAAIPYASAAIMMFGFRRDQFRRPLRGFGIVVPQQEKRSIIAISLASEKFVGRAPDDRVLVRVFVGGACQPELVEQTDVQLRTSCLQELNELLGLSGQPEFDRVIRWRNAMPQYHVGHLDRVRRIDDRTAAYSNLALAGNAYRGVGIPFCIHSGEQAAEKVLAALNDR